MTNRIWVYTLLALIFVLPVCTVTAMRYDLQNELIGSVPCRYQCVSRNVSEGGCGNFCNQCEDYVTYVTGYCDTSGSGPRNVFTCRTSTTLGWKNVLPCGCFLGLCLTGDAFWEPYQERYCEVISAC